MKRDFEHLYDLCDSKNLFVEIWQDKGKKYLGEDPMSRKLPPLEIRIFRGTRVIDRQKVQGKETIDSASLKLIRRLSRDAIL